MHHMRSEAEAIREQLSTWRETLHRHPELSLKEFWTTDYLKKELTAMGVEIVDWGGETGVVGLLRGARPGKCVALRADIDALPIEEKSGVPFASENPGVMHACGHDSHMAALLGAARLLAARKNDLAGTVKFIFQPAEEIFTGGPLMVKKGVLENPHVDFIFGQHNICEYPAGKGLVSPGPIMACTAFISITVHGKGGHGAVPHLAHDPVVAAAAIVSSLQTVVSRETAAGSLTGRVPALIESGALEEAVGLPMNTETSHVMLCGNPQMVRDTQQLLKDTRQMTKHLRRRPGHMTAEHYW